jgi:copper resistance protein C
MRRVNRNNKTAKWLTSLLAGLAVAVLMMAFSAGLVAAHTTTVTKSDPAADAVLATAPAQVMAQFSEELDTKGSTMIVKDAAGKQVSDGNGKVDLNDANHQTMLAALPATLADGVYTVAWHALLTDGDASDGSFKFTVQGGEPLKVSAPAQAATAAPTAAITATVVATDAPVATAAPTLAATAAATVAPTAAAAPTAEPTTAAAPAAQPTAATPGKLPVTGAPGSPLLIWLAVALLAVVAGAFLSLRLRRTPR